VFSYVDYGLFGNSNCIEFWTVNISTHAKKGIYFNLMCCTHHRVLLLVVVRLRFLWFCHGMYSVEPFVDSLGQKTLLFQRWMTSLSE
jgi:hypothetical protein